MDPVWIPVAVFWIVAALTLPLDAAMALGISAVGAALWLTRNMLAARACRHVEAY